MSIAGARSGQNAEIERRENGEDKRGEKRETETERSEKFI
jgi:hypothetical protein